MTRVWVLMRWEPGAEQVIAVYDSEQAAEHACDERNAIDDSYAVEGPVPFHGAHREVNG